MTSICDSLFARALRAVAKLVCQHPAWVIYPQLVLFVLSVIYTSTHWKLDMTRDNLVGGPTHQLYMKFKAEFSAGNDIAAVVESDDPERSRQFVERLGARLNAETNLFFDVFFKGDLTALGRKALLFLPESDLAQLQKTLVDYRPFVQEFTEATNLDSFFGLINRQFRTAKREENAENTALLDAIPALQRVVTQATDALERPGQPVSPGVAAMFGQGDAAMQRMYITFGHGRIYLVTARPRHPGLIAPAITRMRSLMRETEMEVPGVNAGLTGEQVLDYDEMEQSTSDSIAASVVSLIICSLIFIYGYHQTGRPLKAVACLILGLGYTLAFTFLVVGHLNILTITFAPILIGLAIDFGVHLITRYEEEVRNGATPADAVTQALVYTGQGIITGALTTAMAFLAMGMTEFKGIEEMGVISGGGMILCLIPMLTFLPVLLMRGRQNVIDHRLGHAVEKRARIENFWLKRPVMVISITLAICLIACLQFRKVRFDYNLLHMQSRGMPAVVYENKLLFSGQSVLAASIEVDSLEEARRVEDLVKQLPSVSSVDGGDRGEPVFHLLTGAQTNKLRLVSEIKKEMAGINFAPAPAMSESTTTKTVLTQADLDELSATLYSTMGYLGQAANVVQADRPALAKQLLGLRAAISDFRVKMLSDSSVVPERLAAFQRAFFEDIRQTFDTIKNQDTSSPLRPDDLPLVLRNRFVGLTGKYKVDVYPKDDIWKHENQKYFITQLREAMAPHPEMVTGPPVQLYEYTTLLKVSYQQAALYALAAIAVMVFIHFHSVTCVILSLLPVAIGSIWTMGLMGYCGIPFNPANIMTLPLVIGIGVTNGIHILNRVAEEQNACILAKSTGKAVLVSGLTALTGFGSLILAKHRGIQSLGLIMAIGIGACMIAALTFLPAALHILADRGWSVTKKKTQER